MRTKMPLYSSVVALRSLTLFAQLAQPESANLPGGETATLKIKTALHFEVEVVQLAATLQS